MNGHIIKTEEDMNRDERIRASVDHILAALDGIPIAEASLVLDVARNEVHLAQKSTTLETVFHADRDALDEYTITPVVGRLTKTQWTMLIIAAGASIVTVLATIAGLVLRYWHAG
ncbi:hypothetical protein [uncultured Pseudodesulfovibrio sp.]|uniref:hypothetical protein n=1 Tax=uncultured Pseudodesulfovibrio sp. TaxID=2035858 RepID=UPI0029C646D2|nr:hypothetical protein [uncultured Pseudodesulfovibrio sp.]